MRARAGAALEDRKYFYDTANNERQVVYGSIETDLSPETVLTLGGSYQRDDGVAFASGLPRYSSGADIGLPRNASFTQPWNTARDETKLVYATLEHRLNHDWSLSLRGDWLEVQRQAIGLFGSGGVDPITGLGAYWFAFPAKTGSTRSTFNANLKGAFGWLGRQHDVIAGVDWEKGSAYSSQANMGINGDSIDIFERPTLDEPTRNAEYNWWDYDQNRQAAYGSLRFAVSDSLKWIVGGRYSRYDFDSIGHFSNGTDDRIIRFKESGVFTPYTGLTYALNPAWTAYTSYAETYRPQYQQLAGPLPGSALDPVTSKNYEVGLKGELIPSRLNGSFALYRIERKGEAVVDPSFPQSYGSYNCCYLNQGKVISQGFDAEVSGEVLRGLNVIAGYTYNSNHDKDDSANGRYNSITPKHLLKLWGTYRLPGQAQQWKIGAGAQIQSAHYVSGTASTYNPSSGLWDGGSQPFRFSQGGYAVWSARLDYQVTPQWSVALNINNVFDKHYYQTVGTSRNGNFYGEPRNVLVTLRGSF